MFSRSTTDKLGHFYNSILFNQLQTRMLNLAVSPTEKFLNYKTHLQRVGINLWSYLTPGADDVFSTAIAGLDASQQRNDHQLDEIILRLVQAQDRDWDKEHCANDTRNKLTEIVVAEWKYNYKSDTAWAECGHKESAIEIMEALQHYKIDATLKTHRTHKTPVILVNAAYAQTKFNSAPNVTPTLDN